MACCEEPAEPPFAMPRELDTENEQPNKAALDPRLECAEHSNVQTSTEVAAISAAGAASRRNCGAARADFYEMRLLVLVTTPLP